MKNILCTIITLIILTSCYGQTPNDLKASGLIKFQKQDFKGALVDLEKAVVNAPKDIDVLGGIGITKFMLEDYTGAVTALNKAIEQQSLPELYLFRAMAKSKLNDNKGAIADLNKNIEISPNNIDAYLLRATAKSKEADYKGAINDYSKVIDLDPKNSEAFLSRGLSRIMVNPNDYNSPWCLDFEAAIRLGHPNALEEKIRLGCK